jgi:hypothetical protein
MYRIYTVVNAADTCRDPDDLHYTELGYAENLEEVKLFAEKYIKQHFVNKDTQLHQHNGQWLASDFCSYGATIVIEKMEKIV